MKPLRVFLRKRTSLYMVGLNADILVVMMCLNQSDGDKDLKMMSLLALAIIWSEPVLETTVEPLDMALQPRILQSITHNSEHPLQQTVLQQQSEVSIWTAVTQTATEDASSQQPSASTTTFWKNTWMIWVTFNFPLGLIKCLVLLFVLNFLVRQTVTVFNSNKSEKKRVLWDCDIQQKQIYKLPLWD